MQNRALGKGGEGGLQHISSQETVTSLQLHEEGTKGLVAVLLTTVEQAEYWQPACSIGTQVLSRLLPRADGTWTAHSAKMEATGLSVWNCEA